MHTIYPRYTNLVSLGTLVADHDAEIVKPTIRTASYWIDERAEYSCITSDHKAIELLLLLSERYDHI